MTFKEYLILLTVPSTGAFIFAWWLLAFQMQYLWMAIALSYGSCAVLVSGLFLGFGVKRKPEYWGNKNAKK